MKTVIIQGHTSDSFYMRDDKDREYDGYVPKCFDLDKTGDDIVLEIDIESGKILNWDKEKAIKELNKLFKGN